MAAPSQRVWSGKVWVGAVLTVVVFALLVKLGFWQLARGEEKLHLETRLAARAQMAPLSLATALERYPMAELTGLRVTVTLDPHSDATFLLDNQTFDGKVGYLAYQLAKQQDGHWMLIERGFVPAGNDRRVLPQVDWLTEPQTLTGRLYARSTNPFSDALGLEAGNPHRIQNLNVEALSQWLGTPILPVAFQPQQANWPYPQPWQPLAMSAQKHFGYALQWFTMAAVLAVIVLVIGVRVWRAGRHS
ncbi:SURF1 family protein [Vibrio furnissii]|uniref:SURF1 family protein n=1 Tax=Vibrio furnissii TaxID=29494 RepID=UPI001E2882FC|nr:SURF1 family protein [Vibrio furnissii]